MDHWLLLDEFVDLLKNHHRDGFTGLIAGITENKHSFRIGFDNGNIVLLSFRVEKGSAAMDKIELIQRAKITVHPTTDIPQLQPDLPTTSKILSRLTNTSPVTEKSISQVTEPVPKPDSFISTSRATDSKLRKIIEAAAVKHFGPAGLIACQRHLTHSSLNRIDFQTLMLRIAVEAGANEADVQAFIDKVSK